MYVVNNKYYYSDLLQAIEQAKNILRSRACEAINENFTISHGLKGGICVHLNDNWEKVGNSHLLNVIIKKVQLFS